MVLVGRSSQEYGVNVGVPQGYIFGCTYFYRELVVFIIILFLILLFMLAIILCSESDLPDSVGSGLLISVLGKRTFDINAKMERMSLLTFIGLSIVSLRVMISLLLNCQNSRGRGGRRNYAGFLF